MEPVRADLLAVGHRPVHHQRHRIWRHDLPRLLRLISYCDGIHSLLGIPALYTISTALMHEYVQVFLTNIALMFTIMERTLQHSWAGLQDRIALSCIGKVLFS